MIQWIKNKVGSFLTMQDYRMSTEMLDVDEMERRLIMVIANHYPHGFRELLGLYVAHGRSMDVLLAALERSLEYGLGLSTAMGIESRRQELNNNARIGTLKHGQTSFQTTATT